MSLLLSLMARVRVSSRRRYSSRSPPATSCSLNSWRSLHEVWIAPSMIKWSIGCSSGLM